MERTEWLSYHHLLYFWAVVREGGVSRAAERHGRTLVPTAVGRVVYQYAEDIFGLGGEMLEALRGGPRAAADGGRHQGGPEADREPAAAAGAA